MLTQSLHFFWRGGGGGGSKLVSSNAPRPFHLFDPSVHPIVIAVFNNIQHFKFEIVTAAIKLTYLKNTICTVQSTPFPISDSHAVKEVCGLS